MKTAKKEKIFLHICCGPCTLYPLKKLREEGYDVIGYFYNPNIHPFREFRRRIKALTQVSEQKKLPVIFEKEYRLKEFLRKVIYRENKRCEVCYLMRLEQSVKKAISEDADAFTTTLLYSRYQPHKLIKEIAEDLSFRYKIPFLYRDFREGWEEGQKEAKALDIYRQPYCGCIFSEQERYDKKLRKKYTARKKEDKNESS
ncbi:epoxyqueuosine reductase QueH [Thermodesulfatator atlanticus]|uniref:epoxyqueuosine reductase QueH n=1 Tax=Thermodesulfatator atlanticus TaxID=501497 RepID=UPI0003B78131|nr:epoxyqueuosine reductase QueH [Thermodesulfatator atlanticus]